MRLAMPGQLAKPYTSLSQRARVVSEAWGEENLYCSNCPSPHLRRLPTNTPALDFECPKCEASYQLKSQNHRFSSRINDAAYDKMRAAIMERRTPNILALHYDLTGWTVQNLIVVPSFAFSLSCLEKRNALRSSAERARWVGCNILLVNIPLDARIPLVTEGSPKSPAWVREQYALLRPLTKAKHDARGWTLDVLNIVRRLQEWRRGAADYRKGTPWRAPTEFTLADVYAFAGELARLHPQNKNIEPKIRQQLQILRNMGLVEFLGRGSYRVSGIGARVRCRGNS
jgi:type II restriction enzyme